MFWDELSFRLAKRDINREMEAKNTEEDFYENGLENLEVVKRTE